MAVDETQTSAGGGNTPASSSRHPMWRLKSWLAPRSAAFWISVAVTLAYAITNLSFSYGLDDSVLEYTVRPPASGTSVGQSLKVLRQIFFPANHDQLPRRPLRTAGTYLVGQTRLLSPALPDLLSALGTGLCAYVLIGFLRTAGLPQATANWSALWFFGCVPVVAMGQVTHVSQFVLIAAMYGAVASFERFSASRRIRWLGLSAAVFFVGGLYGEAMLIAAVTVGLLAVVRLLQRRVRHACEAGAFCVFAAFLVLGNRFILTGDPAELSAVLHAALDLRAPDFEQQRQGLGFWGMIGSYCSAFRRETFSSIVFSTSPLLCLMAVSAYVVNGLGKRNWFRTLLMAGLMVLACSSASHWLASEWGAPEGAIRLLACGAALGLLCLDTAGRYPLLSCMIAAGVFILGPVFVIDTHVSYVLPAMAAVLFVAIGKLLEAIRARGPRPLGWAMAGLLAIVGIGNFAGGAYLCASVANDNERLADEIGDEIRDGVILTNFRHAFDLYAFANVGLPGPQCRGDLWFTATVPLWPESRAVRDKQRLRTWLERAREQQKKAYFLVCDHDRLPQKTRFHGPQFLDGDHRLKLVAAHVFSTAAWCFDPLYLLSSYYARHGMTTGFLSYPIFPDMIDDVGVEYAPFQRRLFVTYRLLEVDPAEPGGPSPQAQGIVENYLGYRVTAEDASFVAAPRADASAVAGHGSIRSSKLDNVLREIRCRDSQRGEGFPAIEIADDDALGTRIIHCQGRYFALASEGPFDLTKALAADGSSCYRAASLEDARRWFDPATRGALIAKLAPPSPPAPSGSPLPELCVEGLHGFNIIRCGDQYFGLRQADGEFILQKALSRAYPVCLAGNSIEQVKQLIEASVATTASRKPNTTQSTN